MRCSNSYLNNPNRTVATVGVCVAKLDVLKIADIEENPLALRTKVEKESLAYQELKDQIEEFGLLNPISVRLYTRDDGTTGYRLVDGLHRKTAYSDLGYEEIPVNIVDVEDSKLLAAQISANNNVKTTKVQFAQAMKQMQQHGGLTVAELANAVKKSKKWVEDQLGLLDLPEKVRKLVDEGKVNSLNALSLRKIPAEHLDDFIQGAITDTSEVFQPRVETFVNELKKAASTGRKASTEFIPSARPRKTTELKAAYEQFKQNGFAPELKTLLDTQGVNTPEGAVGVVLEWLLHLDPVSVSAEKAKWEQEKAAKEELAKQRAAERAAKKEAAAKEAVAAVAA